MIYFDNLVTNALANNLISDVSKEIVRYACGLLGSLPYFNITAITASVIEGGRELTSKA